MPGRVKVRLSRHNAFGAAEPEAEAGDTSALIPAANANAAATDTADDPDDNEAFDFNFASGGFVVGCSFS